MEMQRIVLFGAATNVGEHILNEALNRGHKVTAIVSEAKRLTKSHPNLKVVEANPLNKNDVISKIKGHDVVICAYEIQSNPADHITYTANLIDAVNADEIRQIIVLGHPGITDIETSLQTPDSPKAWKEVSEAQQKTLDILEDKANARWTYVHLSELSTPPGKNGKPQPSTRFLVKNSEGEQYVPIKEYPQAVLDEAEHFISETHTEL